VDPVRIKSSLRAWLLHFTYDVLWACCGLITVPWWLTRCLLNQTFRRLVWERLGLSLGSVQVKGDAPRVLVHGVSVGEVKAAQALILGLEARGYEVVISATTDTGLAVAAKLYGAERIARFPLDFSPVVSRFLRVIRPDAVVLVELEVWPSFLLAANRIGLPVAVVNGRITERSYERYDHFSYLLPQFHRISMFCVQDEEYAERFRRLSSEQRPIEVTGNIKFDALPVESRESEASFRELLLGSFDGDVVVFGSTHEGEERWAVTAWRESFEDAALIIVPRHPDRCRTLALEFTEAGHAVQRLTELRETEVERDLDAVLLVDTIGELEEIYCMSDVAFVGGTLVEHGGQNMLEPAAVGKAVVHGPNVKNFVQEARLLQSAGASVVVQEPEELGRAVAELLADGAKRAGMGERAREAILGQRGATGATLRALEALLPKAGSDWSLEG
jgi:3-deoxy-D-manno-octulosonic-acid transferase